MKLFVEVFKTDTGYAAHAPSVLGCVATGTSLEETEELIAQALQLHLELKALPELEFRVCA